jgi:bacterioferritin
MMKGNEKILEVLNDLLADELTAVNQYMVHAEMNDDWSYTRLAEVVEKRAIDEMKHAEKLIARILFLEGTPIVSKYNKINIGAAVEKQFDNDWSAEADAIKAYNDAIKVCCANNDHGTEQLLKSILKDEEDHIDWLESQKEQVAQIGIQNYLGQQIKEEE